MPIFAHIDFEESVQVNDRTRIDASKTFVTQNESAFSSLYIQPGLGEADVSVYSTTTGSRYLDWEFGALKLDIDSTNNKIDFSEGATTFAATLTGGSYTLATLATEMATQLNSVGAVTYTVSVDSDDKMTISGDSAFTLIMDGTNKNSLVISQLFFDEDSLSGTTSYTSERIEYGTRRLTVTAGDDRIQVQTITCGANTSHALAGKYFFIWSALSAIKYTVWFYDGTGSDPAISGTTGVQVTIVNNDTAPTVATAVASALDALAGFVATAGTSVVTVTNATSGYATPARVGTVTTFTFAVTTYGQTQVTESTHTKVYSVLGDRLFSNDASLETEEPTIRKWVAQGRNTFNDLHRTVQSKILEYLDREGFVDIYEEKYTKWSIVDLTEVQEWARYMALRLLFESFSNSKDDIYLAKRDYYSSMEIAARQRAILRLDVDGDGETPPWEGADNNSISLYFR